VHVLTLYLVPPLIIVLRNTLNISLRRRNDLSCRLKTWWVLNDRRWLNDRLRFSGLSWLLSSLVKRRPDVGLLLLLLRERVPWLGKGLGLFVGLRSHDGRLGLLHWFVLLETLLYTPFLDLHARMLRLDQHHVVFLDHLVHELISVV